MRTLGYSRITIQPPDTNIAMLDEHFPTHGNWQGLSLGNVTVVCLAYILSEGDHRLNSVRGWAVGLLLPLSLHHACNPGKVPVL